MAIINIDEILNAFDESFAEAMPLVDEAMADAITDDYYQWDGITVRHDGTTAGSPRDIVDRGGLALSQHDTRISISEHEFSWDADHASKVHNGARSNDGHVSIARPWTHHAIRGDQNAPIEYQSPDALMDVPTVFADKINAKLAKLQ
jgi:hypothetical protein